MSKIKSRSVFAVVSLVVMLAILPLAAYGQAKVSFESASKFKVGDVIACHDVKTGTLEWRQVVAFNKTVASGTLTVHLVNAATGQLEEPITCRADKRFVSGINSLAATDFQIGRTLTAKDGEVLRITRIDCNRPITVNVVEIGPLTPAQLRLHPLSPSLPQPNILSVERTLASLKILPSDAQLSRLKVGDMIQSILSLEVYHKCSCGSVGTTICCKKC